jgi:hypothetical protein
MLRLTKKRRDILAEKFGDLANLAVGALVFGQVIGPDVFSSGVAVAGMVIWLLLMAFTLALNGDSR